MRGKTSLSERVCADHVCGYSCRKAPDLDVTGTSPARRCMLERFCLLYAIRPSESGKHLLWREMARAHRAPVHHISRWEAKHHRRGGLAGPTVFVSDLVH